MANVFRTVRDRVSLSATYAEDGAFLSAARCLREAADLLEEHGRRCNDILGLASDNRHPFNPQGSGPAPIAPREG